MPDPKGLDPYPNFSNPMDLSLGLDPTKLAMNYDLAKPDPNLTFAHP